MSEWQRASEPVKGMVESPPTEGTNAFDLARAPSRPEAAMATPPRDVEDAQAQTSAIFACNSGKFESTSCAYWGIAGRVPSVGSFF